MSAIEIYNENVRDLIMPLVPGAPPTKKSSGLSLTRKKSIFDKPKDQEPTALKIRENPSGPNAGVYVEGLSRAK